MKRTLSSFPPVPTPAPAAGDPSLLLAEDEWQAAKPHEECGIFAIFRRDPPDRNNDLPAGAPGAPAPVDAAHDVRFDTYQALFALQHRGQESCGIAVNHDGVISCYKDVGLVTDVFTRDRMSKMTEGEMAVGHCRYGTTGTLNSANAQPLLVNHLKGAMALCHNGNLTNAAFLRERYEMAGAIFHTTTNKLGKTSTSKNAIGFLSSLTFSLMSSL